MVNTKVLAVIQIVAAPRRGPLLVEMMGFEPMTSELEIRCSTSELQPHLSLTMVGLIFDLTSSRDFCEFFYAVIGGV